MPANPDSFTPALSRYPVLQGRGNNAVLDAYAVGSPPVTVTIRRDGRVCRTHTKPVPKDALERELKALLSF